MERIALYHDSFQNWKSHDIEKAQLILTDIPYQLGANMYGSNPMWYEGGDNKNGESKFAGKQAFDTDSKAGFRIAEFFHFCSNLLKKEPKNEKGKAGCMILFCAYEQQEELIHYAKKYGFNHHQVLIFYKNYSAIKRRDGRCMIRDYEPCCGQLECSHFHSVGASPALRFYPPNAYAQCQKHHWNHHNRKEPASYNVYLHWMMEHHYNDEQKMLELKSRYIKYTDELKVEIIRFCNADKLDELQKLIEEKLQ